MILDKGGAYAEAFLMRTGGDEADGADTVVHQFAGQFATCYVLIADGEVKTVGNGLVEISVIDDVEAVLAEYLLQLVGAVTVHLHLLPEVVR